MPVLPRALVVDDDPDISLVCLLHLEDAGFAVLEAASGEAALAVAVAEGPDVIVLDYMLPDLDGVEVLRRLRAQPATATTPVLMLTARTHQRDRDAALAAGATEFMVKPFDGSEFVDTVARLARTEAPAPPAPPVPPVPPVPPMPPVADLPAVPAGDPAVDTGSGSDGTPLPGTEPYLAAVVRDARDAIICKDLDGTITFWNRGAEELYGWSAVEAIGSSITMIAAPESVEEIRDILTRIARGERVTIYDTVRMHRDGHRLHISLGVSPLRDATGAVVGASAIARDMTERVKRESRYEGLLEAAPDAMVLIDEHGVIEMVNQQAEIMFGHDRFKLLGNKVEMLVPERFRSGHPALRRRYAANPRTREMGAGRDLAGLRASGEEFPVEISLSPLEEGTDGRRYAAAIRDVSERRATEARFRGLLDAAPDAMVAVDADGCVQLVNKQAESLFGYRREELLGQAIEVLVPELSRERHVELRERYLRNGGGARTFGGRGDLVARRRDGTLLPVEISLSSLSTSDGVVVCAAIRDISQRRRADDRFRAAIESAPDAMVIVSQTGAIELVNRQVMQLFGYEREELLGQPMEMLLPLRHRGRHPEHRRRFVRSPRLRPMGAGLQLSALRRDGTEFPVEISLSPIDSEGSVSVCATIRDVTVRREIEEAQRVAAEREREASQRLREVDRLRTDFLATVSHELRTPLTAIKGFSEWLVGSWEATPDERRRALVERIHHAGRRLDFLIQDLLDFSRLERGTLKIEPGRHEVAGILEDALANLDTALEQHRVELEVEPGLAAYVDRSTMLRVVENLLTNAVKFSPDGSTIGLRATKQGGAVEIVVADEGSGIPAEEHEKVFDRFYRSPSTASATAGTGIGLAIVKHFVEAQDGTVELESEVGHGCTVRVTVPRAVG